MVPKEKKEKRDTLMKKKACSTTSPSTTSVPLLRSAKSTLNTKKDEDGAEMPVQLDTIEYTSTPPTVKAGVQCDEIKSSSSVHGDENRKKNTGGSSKTRKRISPNKASVSLKKKEKASKVKQKSGKEVPKPTRKRSRPPSSQSLQPKIEKRLEKSEQYDALLGEAQDLMGAAAEAQALGRLKLASSYMLLLHARLVGLGKIFDRAIASEPRLKSAVHSILSQDINHSCNSQKESYTHEGNNIGNLGKNDNKIINLAHDFSGAGGKKDNFINKERTELSNTFTSLNMDSEVTGTLHPPLKSNLSIINKSDEKVFNKHSKNNTPVYSSCGPNKQTSHVTNLGLDSKLPFNTMMETACNNSNNQPNPVKKNTNNIPRPLEITNKHDKEIKHLNLNPNTFLSKNTFTQNQNNSSDNSSTSVLLSTNQLEMSPKNPPELKSQPSPMKNLHRPPLPLKTPPSTTPSLSSVISETMSLSTNQTNLKSSLPSSLQQRVHSAEAALLLTNSLPKEINLDTTMMEHLAKAAIELHQKRISASSNGTSEINPSAMKTVNETESQSMSTEKYSTTLSSLSSALLPQQEDTVKKDKIIAWSEEEKRTCEKASDIYGTSNPDKITKMMRGTRTETEVRAHLKTKEEKEKVDRELSDMNISIEGCESKNSNITGLNSLTDKTKLSPISELHSTTPPSNIDDNHLLITNDIDIENIENNDMMRSSISKSNNGKGNLNTSTTINATESVNETTKSRSRTNVFSHFDARLMIMQGGNLPSSAFTPANPPTTPNDSTTSKTLEQNKS